jgi:predicted Zn-dependent protease
MKQKLALISIALLGIAAITLSERRKVEVSPGPAAILSLIGDTEKELTRMPVRFTRLTDAEEIAIGNRLAAAYLPYRDPQREPKEAYIEEYLTEVGWRLAAGAKRKLLYQFHYVPDKHFVNAFALPGGHVFVGHGLLALMDGEDELASVIAHEIEHIDQYHCAERVQWEQALRKVSLGGIAAVPILVFQAGYSKEQELQADREGTRLMVSKGYSANGAIRLVERFQGMQSGSRQSKAKDPGEELRRVADQALEGYFRSHPLPSERIALIQRLIADNRWPLIAERDSKISYLFWTERAAELLKQGKYVEAQGAASRSLKIQPEQQAALDVLARAYFAQANFSEAAAAYRRILELEPTKLEFAKYFAYSLAAADKQSAATEFERWQKSARADLANVPTAMAGLYLLAGNPAPAASLHQSLLSKESPADQYGELGWWYYLAGDYPQALTLLETAVQLHPGDAQWLTSRAWVQIQIKKFEDAFQGLNSVGDTIPPYTHMARGVAYWMSDQKDSAVHEFNSATEGQPEWKNDRWVRALYSPLIVDTVLHIQAESERLRKLQQARLNSPQ